MSPIYYESSGKGQPVVLLHGYCETSYIWHRFRPALSDTAWVLTPDLPGFGGSAPLTAGFTIEDVARQLKQWMESLNLVRPVVIGHSLGGYVAQSLALNFPDYVGGLGLFHSTVFSDSEERKANRNKVIEFLAKNPVGTFTDAFVPTLFYQRNHPEIPALRDIASQQPAAVIAGYAAAMRDRPDYTDAINEKISAPVLLIAGQYDVAVPLEISQKIAQIIKKISFSILEETGHMGFFESEAKSLDVVRRFLTLCDQPA